MEAEPAAQATLLNRLRHLFGPRVTDTTTEEGRAHQRHRRIALSATASGLSTVIATLVSLITVPLTMDYLGKERYGLWIVVNSTVHMLAFADLGLGNGLIKSVSRAMGKDDRGQVISLVSNTFFLLVAIAGVLALVAAVAVPSLPWRSLLGISRQIRETEITATLAVVTACFLTRFPLSIVGRIRMGLQEAYITDVWRMAGAVGQVILLTFAIKLNLGLPILCLILAGLPVLTDLANWATLVAGRRWTLPRAFRISRRVLRDALGTGLLFLVLQLCTLVSYESNNLIISSVLGVERVPDYSIPMRLFMFGPTIMAFVLRPLWPAYGEAVERGDLAWVKRTLQRSMQWSLALILPGGLLLVLLANPILRLWIGDTVSVERSMAIALYLFIVESVLITALSRFLNGIGAIGFQVACNVVLAILSVPLAVWLAGRVGIPGVVWSRALLCGFTVLLPSSVYIHRYFRLCGDTKTTPTSAERE